MNVVWYWWGFRLYVDDGFLHQLTNALQQGSTGVKNFLNGLGLSWINPIVPLIVQMVANVGLTALRATDSNCGHRGCSLTVPWTLWNSYAGCR